MGDPAGSERMAKKRDSVAKGDAVDGERVRCRLKRHIGEPRLTNKQQTIMATILRQRRSIISTAYLPLSISDHCGQCGKDYPNSTLQG